MNLEFEKYKELYWKKKKPLSQKDLKFLKGLGNVVQCDKSFSDTERFFPTPSTPRETIKFFGEKFLVISQVSWRIKDSYSLYISTMSKYYEIEDVTEEEKNKIIDAIFEGNIKEFSIEKYITTRTEGGLTKDWTKKHGFS